MFSELLRDWRKGAGHKYMRRTPYMDKRGRKRYRYTYQAQRGGGVTQAESMIVGSAFKLTHKGKKGHFHIESVDEGKLKLKHDESGGELELTKGEFQRLLQIEHGEALGQAAERAEATAKQAKKTGTKKQAARAEAEARKMREIAEQGKEQDPERAQVLEQYTEKLVQAENDLELTQQKKSFLNRLIKEAAKEREGLDFTESKSIASTIAGSFKADKKDLKIASDRLTKILKEKPNLSPEEEKRVLEEVSKKKKAHNSKIEKVLNYQIELYKKSLEIASAKKSAEQIKEQANKKIGHIKTKIRKEYRTGAEETSPYIKKQMSEIERLQRERDEGIAEAENRQKAAETTLRALSDRFNYGTPEPKAEPKAKEPKAKEPKAKEPKAKEPKAELERDIKELDPPKPKQRPQVKEGLGLGVMKGHKGKPARLLMQGESGRPQRHDVIYALVEADSVIASHNPITFDERADYPKGIQERDYKRDKTEQRKVILNAQNFYPELQVSTNPDAVNGPPILTPSGHAIGGNSRAMTVQRLHGVEALKGQRDEYLQTIRDEAASFGLDPAQVDSLKNPMLVRVMQKKIEKPDEVRTLVRVANESFTGGMSAEVKSRRAGLSLDDRAVKSIADAMSDHEGTLNNLLTTPSEKLGPLVSALRRAGIITQQNFSEMIKTTSKGQSLSGEGAERVEAAIVGRLVPDLATLSALPSNFKSSKLPSMALELLRSGDTEKHSEAVQAAARAYGAISQRLPSFEGLPAKQKLSQTETQLNQRGLMGRDEALEGIKEDPNARAWFDLMVHAKGPLDMKKKTARALVLNQGTEGLFPEPPVPLAEAVKTAIKGK